MKLYAFLKKLAAGFFRKIYRIEATGLEKIPTDGPLLICPNHISLADVIMIGVVFDRQLRFMAKAELFKIPLLGRLITALGAFPVDRQHNDVGAIRKAENIIKDGNALVMFPQGTRCRGVNPQDTKIKYGVSMIAGRSGATVLPVCIQTKNYTVKMFRKIYIRVGDPISPEQLRSSGESYREQAEYIFSRVTDLIV